jgi:hypothetical protein
MAVEFSISGGHISLPKKLFIREMLRPSSLMKKLLNYELHHGDRTRYLDVDREGAEDRVTIRFNRESRVLVGEDYSDLIRELKGELKGELQGTVTLMADYYQPISLTLDLNSPDGHVREIF